MKLQPLNSDTRTQSLISETQQIEKKILKKSHTTDPSKVIPVTIYNIINSQIRTLIAFIVFCSLMIFTGLVLIFVFALKWHTGLFLYIFPSLLIGLFGYKWILLIMEYKFLIKSVSRYREDLKYNLTSSPQFLSRIYENLIKRQISHNWITFFLFFYIGIFTLIIFWLKTKNWGFLKFGTWINNAFIHPELVVGLLSFSLVIILLIYVYCSIQRKKQILRINSFFGSEIISSADIMKIKSELNKSWRRWFIISIFVILVIPLIVWIILRLIRRRK